MSLPDLYRERNLVLARQGGSESDRTFVAPDRLDLKFLVSVFRRRLALFGIVVGAFVLLAFGYTLQQPKLFQATADVVMNKDRGEIVPDPAAVAKSDAPLRSEEIDTELKIILSQELASRVVDSLKLDRNEGFVHSATGGNGLVASVKRTLGMAPTVPVTKDLRRRLADALLANLTAKRMETAYAIRIAYTSPDPQLAADIANAIARAYANSAVDAKRVENEKTLALLRSRIDELRDQAQGDFKEVQDFRVRNNLLSAQATQLAELEASAYGQQLATARAAAAADRGRANAAGGAASAAAVNSPVVASLRSQRAAISVRVAEMSGRYLDTHPDLISARQELADIDRQIDAEIGRVRSGVAAGLASSAQATAQQVGSLQGNLSSARGTLAANNRALVGLDDLSRKAQSSQSLYENYLNRYKEVLAQSGIERPEARLLSPAKIPGFPVSPNLLLNLMLGLVIGSLAGAGAAIATESNYSGLTTGDDVEGRLGIRYGGGMPLLSSVGVADAEPAASLVTAPGSAYAEAVRGLLTSVRQSAKGRCQVIAVTSALPGEGKTSLAASLARIAAQSGETAIVIDCDLVRRDLSAMLSTDKSRPGLREVMRDGVKLGDAMIKDSAGSAMVLPITKHFTDGERLLERGNFHTMIGMMREHFSLIILDAAPILPIAETREIVSLADSVIVTSLWRHTPDSAIRAALRLLPLHAIDNICVALNRIDMKKQVKFGAGDVTFYYDKYKKYYANA